MASNAVTIRLPDEVNERFNLQVAKAECTKTQYLLEALLWALERDETRPTPAVVKAAMPRWTSRGITMPEGVVHDRQF